VSLTKTLRLIVPGLLGPWQIEPGFCYPRAKALAYLLGRATVKSLPIADADALLCKLFGFPVFSNRDLPIAALTHLADNGMPADGWWLRADPVHLHADMRQVLLFDAHTLTISAAEADSLVTEFNQAFNNEGLQLKALHPSRWYLYLGEDPGIRTEPLSKVVGRDITPFLPHGVNARDWCRLLTEVQMLFHSSMVNRERQTKGQMPINGLWFWGGGVLPDPVHTISDIIYASDPVAQGLALLSAAKLKSVPDTASVWRNESRDEIQNLVVLEATRYDSIDNAIDTWRSHVDSLEKDWFAPCLTMLRKKEFGKLILYPCNGLEYSVAHSDLWRFWRRIRSLQHYTQS
jgi:hypothetical protein